MRKPDEAREYLTQATCPVCGKIFCPAPYHIYEDDNGIYCSWTCFNHRNDNKPKSRPKGRPARQVEQLTLDGEVIATFAGAEKAADAIDGWHAGIREACKKYPKKYRNYLWRFKD